MITTDNTMTGKLKRFADRITGADTSATEMPIAAPTSPADGLLSSGNTEVAAAKQNATTGILEPSAGDVAGFKRFEPYSLSVSVREAARGYGKKAGSGNRNLIYVDVSGWDQLAICRVSDREQWRPHDRLDGVFHRLTPDYMLEFAYQPGRRAGKGGR
jgi:hypothetical protein